MSFTINIRNRKGKLLGAELPIYWTLEQILAEEAANPGTIAAVMAQASDILDGYRGVAHIQDGVFAGYSLGFAQAVNATVPSGQTHEERVKLTYEAKFTDGSANKKFSTSVPTPDLAGDWTFPAGQDRVYEPGANAAFSLTAQAYIENVREWMQVYAAPGIDSVIFLYADLVGANV